jgi:hypothetical protein
MGDNSYDLATIPSEIINLPILQYLYLQNCDLQGDLDFLPNMTDLQEFWIDKNEGIRGTIPTDIGQLNGLGEYMSTRPFYRHRNSDLSFSLNVCVYI